VCVCVHRRESKCVERECVCMCICTYVGDRELLYGGDRELLYVGDR